MASAMTSSSSSLPNTGRSSPRLRGDDFPPDVSSRAGRKAGSRPARPLSRLRLFIWNPPSSLDDPDVLSASGSHRSRVSSLFTAGEARMLRGFCRMAVIEYERSCSRLNASRSSDSSSSSSSSNSRDGSSSMPSMCSSSSSIDPWVNRRVSPGASDPPRAREDDRKDEGARRHARWLPRHRTEAPETHRRDAVVLPPRVCTAGILPSATHALILTEYR
mmetsp:Transcript_2296/g.10427  ORF Transcript_2296/g.10427 Transcript_2296/m.10427 type:complete len:218 (-) Transcript_2296:61-714(-)